MQAVKVDGASLEAALRRQQEAFRAEGHVAASTREDRLDRLGRMLLDNELLIAETVARDFGHRAVPFSRYAEVASSLKLLRHSRRHLRKWMRPRRRPLEFPLGLLGATARVHWVPKGVVGIISPWNYPVILAIAPLVDALAAGNRAMIKPSEHSGHTSALLADLVEKTFDPSEVTVCSGGVEVGQAFSRLPFDHLVFTGGTEVGRLVMESAARNLVPVTLELGGKCPAVIGRSARFDRAVESVILGRLINSGQMCMGVDYVCVPTERIGEFVDLAAALVGSMYPTLAANPEFVSIIGPRHHARLIELVEEARAAGVRVVEINPSHEDLSDPTLLKIPPTLVVDPDPGLRIMREEIFGPVLPVVGYRTLDEVVDFVNGQPRPLALYYFGRDRRERREVLSRTISGGVSVNEVIVHAVAETLPFGGIGASGMGVYHGIDGFRQMSHPRAVLDAPRVSLWRLLGLRPPYGKQLQWMTKRDLRA